MKKQILKTTSMVFLLILLCNISFAQQNISSVYKGEFKNFIRPDTFLFIPFDSIFYCKKIKAEFKHALKPTLSLFNKRGNYHLSVDIYQSDENADTNNIKRIDILYKYLISNVKYGKYIRNALHYHHDMTSIYRAEYFANSPRIPCVTFDLKEYILPQQ